MLDGVEIQQGWLHIAKHFNEKYKNQTDFGVDSNLENSVMIDLRIDENLKKMGVAREIVNRVQKLRKAAGLNIEDQVEIFYELPNVSENLFEKVVKDHAQ